ncbi:MAG: hypothetical protein OEO21_07110 [Candidatus Krumholzibacteria bacterium]|nr:hypothetical protein [Candidatus Krumholzibacteria bacterium]
MRVSSASFVIIATLLLAALALVSSCGEEATPVQTAPAGDEALLAESAAMFPPGGMWARYYPLRTGNHWRADRQFRAWYDDGTVVADIGGESSREMIGEEVLFGRTYAIEEWRLIERFEGLEDTTTYWIRYRQDRDGLYEANVAMSEPPVLIAAAGKEGGRRALTVSAADGAGVAHAILRNETHPGRRAAIAAHLERHRRLVTAAMLGADALAASAAAVAPEDEELTRLVYPLRRGREWVIREDPLFTSAAEGRDLLRLPIGRRVGMRVRIVPVELEPDADVLLWYSNCGLLRMYVSVQTEMTDFDGTPLGTLFTEEIVELVEADVLGRPWCGR